MQMPTGRLGYDRAIVVFSPEGRIFQVEYAREAVKQGTPSVGLLYKDGVILAGLITSRKLSDDSTKKVHQLDEHVGAVVSGVLADSRVLVDQARVKAQVYRVTYQERIDTATLVKEIGDIKQMHTQIGGLRPMGISFLIGGYDSKPSLFETDPGGAIFKWKAQAIGRNSDKMKSFLEDNWKEGMTEKKAIKLVLDALKETEKKVTSENIEMVKITEDGFEKIEDKEKFF